MQAPAGRYAYPAYLIGFFLCAVACYAGMYALGYFSRLPTADDLLRWDAGFYHAIMQDGYAYTPGVQGNAGFYPLFGYFWRLTGLGAVGISVVNVVVYLLSLYAACRLLRPRPVTLALFMALPFVFFFYLPFSESLFLLFSVGILYGFARDRPRLLFAAVLLAGLTRPTALFLVPTLVGATLMGRPREEILAADTWRRIAACYLLPSLLAFLVVALVQYVQVGDAMAYYKLQSAVWGRKFGLPVFPLHGDVDNWILLLRSLNLWVGALAASIGLYYLIRWLTPAGIAGRIRPLALLAVIYLTMCLISIVFFNPAWHWINDGGYNSTILTGINRYVQANGFLLVFMVYVFEWKTPRWWHLPVLLAGTYLLLFTIEPGYYKHIRRTLHISWITAIAALYWAYYFLRWAPLGYALAAVSLTYQCRMMQGALTGSQVD